MLLELDPPGEAVMAPGRFALGFCVETSGFWVSEGKCHLMLSHGMSCALPTLRVIGDGRLSRSRWCPFPCCFELNYFRNRWLTENFSSFVLSELSI